MRHAGGTAVGDKGDCGGEGDSNGSGGGDGGREGDGRLLGGGGHGAMEAMATPHFL